MLNKPLGAKKAQIRWTSFGVSGVYSTSRTVSASALVALGVISLPSLPYATPFHSRLRLKEGRKSAPRPLFSAKSFDISDDTICKGAGIRLMAD